MSKKLPRRLTHPVVLPSSTHLQVLYFLPRTSLSFTILQLLRHSSSKSTFSHLSTAVGLKHAPGSRGGGGGLGEGGGGDGDGGLGGGGLGDGGGGEGDGGTANLSCRKRTVTLPPHPVSPWFVCVRTSRYLLGAVGVHSVVVPSSGNVFVLPLSQVLWRSVATHVHGPKFASPV